MSVEIQCGSIAKMLDTELGGLFQSTAKHAGLGGLLDEPWMCHCLYLYHQPNEIQALYTWATTTVSDAHHASVAKVIGPTKFRPQHAPLETDAYPQYLAVKASAHAGLM